MGAKPLISEALLAEVNFLVENPIAYVGRFKPEFLKVPQEVLVTSMQKNQKYFPLVDKSGRLQAQFVVVTDGCKNKGVVEGNQKVLSARLADARFFFEEDCKMSLRMRLPDLEKVSFFEKLGTLAQKAERIAGLSAWIGQRLKLDEARLKTVHRIAMLCKADLTTKMVYEFPELQGVMGREYARLAGESPAVAEGIFEHYLPRHAEDKLPLSPEGTVVALADRIDSLVGCFSVGAVPTGSEDPYGLRRAVQGIIRIMTEKKVDLLLDETIEQSYKLYKPILQGAEAVDFAKVKKELFLFIAGRLKPVLLDKGIRYDVVDAVLFDCNDILDCITKAGVLNRLVGEAWFPGVIASADRVFRIAGTASREAVEEAILLEKEEKELFELYNKVNWETGEAINKEEWEKAARALAALTDPLERFFDKVLVMHKEEKIKLNRLALLKSIDKLYSRIADFKKIVIEGSKK
jgi:glycyl-tRNA synthetase beta chain